MSIRSWKKTVMKWITTVQLQLCMAIRCFIVVGNLKITGLKKNDVYVDPGDASAQEIEKNSKCG